MITKKAAIGFILLAIITFTISSYDSMNPITPPAKQTVIEVQQIHMDNTNLFKNEYHAPIFDFGKNTPYVITAIMELFALVCYIVLKRVEPRINAWADETRERVREEREDSNS